MILTCEYSPKISPKVLNYFFISRAKSEPETEKAEYEEKVMKVLRNSEANYDKDQTLIICQMLGFKAGILYLYEENKL